HALLGTDNLGRDVLSRFLWGGGSVLGLSILATVLGLALGVSIGLLAAYTRTILDDVFMRGMAVMLPSTWTVLALVIVAGVGTVMPVIAIALLTIGTSLIGDGVARAASGIERGGDR